MKRAMIVKGLRVRVKRMKRVKRECFSARDTGTGGYSRGDPGLTGNGKIERERQTSGRG